VYYHLQVFVKPALSKLDYAIAPHWSVYGYVPPAAAARSSRRRLPDERLFSAWWRTSCSSEKEKPRP